MTEGMVRKWIGMFNVHDENRSGLPFLVTDDPVSAVDAKMRDRRFTMAMLSGDLKQISRTLLYEYEILTHRLSYRELCSRWVLKMLTDVPKAKRQ